MFAIALIALGVIILVLALIGVHVTFHAALVLLGIVAILAGLSQTGDFVARFRNAPPNG